MKTAELLSRQLDARRIADARSAIRQELQQSGRFLVVVDDDPTGAQTIQDVRVFMDWSVETLCQAIDNREPVFFLSVNSRSLDTAAATTLGVEVGNNIRRAAEIKGVEILLASRSDSTLRGHFPAETDALAKGSQLEYDGLIFVPAFMEAGRYTIDDVQWVEQAGEIVPVTETEFSRDPVFAYKNSHLKRWIEEKTAGRVRAAEVLSISLDRLRTGGPEAVAALLDPVSSRACVIANAACYEDLEVLALGVIAAEKRGKRFLYRCSASFIKARGGFADKGILSAAGIRTGKGPGLVVVGSYVDKTSRQLSELLASGQAQGIELRVPELETAETRNAEIESRSRMMDDLLSKGITPVLYTSRTVDTFAGRNFSETAKTVMDALVETVRQVRVPPAYIIAKGGITSYELARTGLRVREAFVLGQILAGVPVWRLDSGSLWPNIPFVVFPGNVGDDSALCNVVAELA